ncbi:MAG: M67 family metallopeptidase [Armatimonadetes bacterium]|nr:M67 family metallopeptidase [Armatimonadota bacterium]
MLYIPSALYKDLLDHGTRASPKEACGILAGRQGRTTAFYPAVNVEEGHEKYSISPQELARILKDLEGKGLDLIGIFHSHPATPAYPSVTDVELACYPDSAYVILSLGDEPSIKAFSIREGKVTDIPITIEPSMG